VAKQEQRWVRVERAVDGVERSDMAETPAPSHELKLGFAPINFGLETVNPEPS